MSIIEKEPVEAITEIQEELEFKRNSYVLIPRKHNKHSTFAVVESGAKHIERIFCSCTRKGYATCESASRLKTLLKNYIHSNSDKLPSETFLTSYIYDLLVPVANVNSSPTDQLQHIFLSETHSKIQTKSAQKRASLYGIHRSHERLLERLGLIDTNKRNALMAKAHSFVCTDHEKTMIAMGAKTQRLTTENSLWYYIAYQIYREFGSSPHIGVDVNMESGEFALKFAIDETASIEVIIPKEAIPEILRKLLNNNLIESAQINPQPQFLKFRIEENDSCPVIIPVIEFDGNVFDIVKRFVFQNVIFVPEISRFLYLDTESLKLFAQGWDCRKVLGPGELSSFLEENAEIFSTPGESNEQGQTDLFLTAPKTIDYKRIVNKQIVEFTSTDVNLHSQKRDWLYLSINYNNDKVSCSLKELLAAKKSKDRFILKNGTIIDIGSEKIKKITVAQADSGDQNTVRMSRASFLMLTSSGAISKENTRFTGELKNLVDMVPRTPLEELLHFNSHLRPYQVHGVEWLLFLYDNSLGGLLCDDMGLGKTHQVLGFFAALRQQRACKKPFLVVCPTSVISHWINLTTAFAPFLRYNSYHGDKRVLNICTTSADLYITSYGILRNDIEEFLKIKFGVVVFDEAQQLKNAGTLGHLAAAQVQSEFKVGLSGTPIENNLGELKALTDLVLPGLLGSDEYFNENFRIPIETFEKTDSKKSLARSISPFILRRKKQAILNELPPKIEDFRSCKLSLLQESLYKDTISRKANVLITALNKDGEPIPYMHLFAVLSTLKQICNHPALVSGDYEKFDQYESGKWELFKEIVDESLGSGEKIVVFSQYLGMIEIIGKYLGSLCVKHAVLTGASSNRGDIINSFNSDPECKVFVSSLKAGGVGIELTSASVVIHYDRWWNAAREDQATDRVHRFGQTKCVQVFYLITQGTLEEKIDSMIKRKRVLAESILVEDAPDSLKIFTRDELLEILGGFE